MKSNLVSKSQTAEIISAVEDRWHIKAPKVRNLRIYHIEDDMKIITDEMGWSLVRVGDDYLPFLANHTLLQKFPSVTVDMGAVRFMCNGANIMRPGIREYSEFQEDEIVCVAEESQHKYLAVGISEVASNQIESMEKGQVIKNIHHISDRLWEAGKTVKQ